MSQAPVIPLCKPLAPRRLQKDMSAGSCPGQGHVLGENQAPVTHPKIGPSLEPHGPRGDGERDGLKGLRDSRVPGTTVQSPELRASAREAWGLI